MSRVGGRTPQAGVNTRSQKTQKNALKSVGIKPGLRPKVVAPVERKGPLSSLSLKEPRPEPRTEGAPLEQRKEADGPLNSGVEQVGQIQEDIPPEEPVMKKTTSMGEGGNYKALEHLRIAGAERVAERDSPARTGSPGGGRGGSPTGSRTGSPSAARVGSPGSGRVGSPGRGGSPSSGRVPRLAVERATREVELADAPALEAAIPADVAPELAPPATLASTATMGTTASTDANLGGSALGRNVVQQRDGEWHAVRRRNPTSPADSPEKRRDRRSPEERALDEERRHAADIEAARLEFERREAARREQRAKDLTKDPRHVAGANQHGVRPRTAAAPRAKGTSSEGEWRQAVVDAELHWRNFQDRKAVTAGQKAAGGTRGFPLANAGQRRVGSDGWQTEYDRQFQYYVAPDQVYRPDDNVDPSLYNPFVHLGRRPDRPAPAGQAAPPPHAVPPAPNSNSSPNNSPIHHAQSLSQPHHLDSSLQPQSTASPGPPTTSAGLPTSPLPSNLSPERVTDQRAGSASPATDTHARLLERQRQLERILERQRTQMAERAAASPQTGWQPPAVSDAASALPGVGGQGAATQSGPRQLSPEENERERERLATQITSLRIQLALEEERYHHMTGGPPPPPQPFTYGNSDSQFAFSPGRANTLDRERRQLEAQEAAAGIVGPGRREGAPSSRPTSAPPARRRGKVAHQSAPTSVNTTDLEMRAKLLDAPPHQARQQLPGGTRAASASCRPVPTSGPRRPASASSTRPASAQAQRGRVGASNNRRPASAQRGSNQRRATSYKGGDAAGASRAARQRSASAGSGDRSGMPRYSSADNVAMLQAQGPESLFAAMVAAGPAPARAPVISSVSVRNRTAAVPPAGVPFVPGIGVPFGRVSKRPQDYRFLPPTSTRAIPPAGVRVPISEHIGSLFGDA